MSKSIMLKKINTMCFFVFYANERMKRVLYVIQADFFL